MARPSRSSSPAGHRAGLVRLLRRGRAWRGWCRRSCWCPGTWSASLPETRPDGLVEVVQGGQVALARPRSASSWGRGRAAGPNSTLPASARSKVDWWQGHSRLWVVRSFSEIGQPDVGADLGVADDALDRPVQGLPSTRSRSAPSGAGSPRPWPSSTSSWVPSTSGWPSDRRSAAPRARR